MEIVESETLDGANLVAIPTNEGWLVSVLPSGGHVAVFLVDSQPPGDDWEPMADTEATAKLGRLADGVVEEWSESDSGSLTHVAQNGGLIRQLERIQAAA